MTQYIKETKKVTDAVCEHCGLSQDHELLLDGGKCIKCNKEIVKGLF